jgi:rubrerythrin
LGRKKQGRGDRVFTEKEIFDLAMRIEENGEAFYRSAVKKAGNPSLASLFEWLADQEVKHREWFREKRALFKAADEDAVLGETGSAILQEILGEQAFSLDGVDPSGIGSIEKLLEVAVEFEKDSILFYEMIRSFTEDEVTLTSLKKIIQEEQQHVRMLEVFLNEGKN